MTSLSLVALRATARQRAIDNYEQAIVEAVESGASLRAVAKAAGITHMGVVKMVERVKGQADD